ncbi:MAG: HAD family hydrolase [Actinomycetota bacterium]|nr:HAD family hydrolase [Actinomycetota bacterium]
MIRLVVTDLDGTLLDENGRVSQENMDAVALLAEMGIPTIAATARSPRSVRKISATAGLGPLAICANGAVVYDLQDSSVLSHQLISAAVAAEVIRVVRRKVPGAILAGELLEDFYAEPGFFSRPIPGLNVPEIRVLEDHIGPGATKLIARRAGLTSERLRNILGAELAPLVDITVSGPDWIEFAKHGVSKASGILEVCRIMEIETEHVVAVGDQRNDLTMLRLVGHPLTVANAHPELFGLAGEILPHHNHSGFAAIVDYVAARKAG